MFARTLLLAAAAVALALPAFADVSTNPQSAPKGKYSLDPRHTTVTFCIVHMGVSNYCARFNSASGTVTFNGAQPEKSSAKVRVDVASIDTPVDKLDDELRNSFFETAKFPTATFDSSSIKVTGENSGEIEGALTLHGVTKDIVLKTVFNGGREHPMNGKRMLGFSASTTLNLADFAFPDVAWRGFVGDEVTLYIETEVQADQ